MIEIYEKLCEITNENFNSYNQNENIHFETAMGLDFSIFNYPENKLLEIEETETFIYECFYKILDRVVDDENFIKYKNLLNSGQLSKKGLIKEISNSGECQIKMTGLE